MKKILFVTPYFPPHIGGTDHYVYHIARGLHTQRGWDVVVVTSNTSKTIQEKEQRDGITIYRLPILFTFSNTPIHPWWYVALKNIFKEEKPDVINAHSPVPYLSDVASLAAANIPFVLTYHTGPWIRKGEPAKDMLIKLYETCLFPLMVKKAKVIITASDYVKNAVFAPMGVKTVTISPGVDLRLFKPSLQAPIRGNHVMLFVGSLQKAERYKGLDTLLLSLPLVTKRFPEATLMIVGSGDYMNEYKAYCKEFSIVSNVVFKGSLTGNALVQEYQHAALLVHPSRFDSFPLVLLEAMACKIPVISTTVGGIPEIITHGKSGLLVSPENPHVLAKAIIRIFSDSSLANRMRAEAYEEVRKKHSWTSQVNATHEALRNI